MRDEVIQEHRELQLLRAAGVSASHRRRKRRPKPVNKTAAQLEGWVDNRWDKKEATR